MAWLETIRGSVAPSYRDFVDKLDGDSPIGEIVWIYSWASVEERNSTHEMDTYLPSHVSIGSDSGGREFLLRRDGSMEVYLCDSGSLGSMEPEMVHSDIVEWISDGCPLREDDDEEPSLPLSAPIWLIRQPADGLKGMLELRKALGQSWPASDLRTMMSSLPALLLEDGQPYRTIRTLESRPDYLSCLGCGDSPETITPLNP